MFTLNDLQDIAREVIGDPDIVLTPEMNAEDVPGWDSLNHTLIALEIAGRFGVHVDAPALAELRSFGEVVAKVNSSG
jgi:acyl carrier protein